MENPDERTVIATSTINLQHQLYEKDIPMLFRLLGRSCKVALAVGRSNYLCIRRFVEKKQESALLATDPESDLYKINGWASKTDSGLRSDYPYALPSDLWMDINSDSDLCAGHNCPYFSECFYAKAKLKCKEAKIIVSNHHLLFSDAANRLENQEDFSEDGVLPAFSRLIIDEAHNIEDNATEYFTKTYDPKEMHRQLGILERKTGASDSLVEMLSPYVDDDKIIDAIHEQLSGALRLSDEAHRLQGCDPQEDGEAGGEQREDDQPVHPSGRAADLPIVDGNDRFGAGIGVEHDACPHPCLSFYVKLERIWRCVFRLTRHLFLSSVVARSRT